MAARLGERTALRTPRRYQARGRWPIVSGAARICAAVALIVCLFALAGDRLGLWDPLKPAALPAASPTPKKHLGANGTVPKLVRASHSRPVQASPQRALGPPIPAGSALLVAAVAAALAALTSVSGRRMVSQGLHGGLTALVPAARASRSRKANAMGLNTRVSRNSSVRLDSPAARKTLQIRATLIEAVKAEGRRLRASSPSSRHRSTRRMGASLRSILALPPAEVRKLVHIVGRDRSAARAAALEATAFRFRQARGRYMRHQTQVATYAISVVASIMLGWLVVVLLSNP